MSKKQIFEALEKGLRANPDQLKVYYTGHSIKGSGDWITNDGHTITIDQIVKKINKSSFKNGIVWLRMDCNFSGKWVDQAEKLKKQGKLKIRKGVELWLDAECGSNV